MCNAVGLHFYGNPSQKGKGLTQTHVFTLRRGKFTYNLRIPQKKLLHPKDVVGREGKQWIPFPRKPFARTPPSPSRFTFMAVFFVMGFIFFKFVNFCIPFFRAYSFEDILTFCFQNFKYSNFMSIISLQKFYFWQKVLKIQILWIFLYLWGQKVISRTWMF